MAVKYIKDFSMNSVLIRACLVAMKTFIIESAT